jgi:hypothetical protein
LIDIEDVILQRIEQLEEDDPELEMDYELIAPDNRGVITVSYELIPIGAEFVESEMSWTREDAVDEYNSRLRRPVRADRANEGTSIKDGQ